MARYAHSMRYQLDHLSVHLCDVVHFSSVSVLVQLTPTRSWIQRNRPYSMYCQLHHLSVHLSYVAHFCITTGTVDTNKELDTKKQDVEYALSVRSPLSPSVWCSPLPFCITTNTVHLCDVVRFCITTGTVDTNKELDIEKQALQYVLSARSPLSPSAWCSPLQFCISTGTVDTN